MITWLLDFLLSFTMMLMKLVFFFLGVSIFPAHSTPTSFFCDRTAPCGCSMEPVIMSRIVGGEAAVNHSWGWMVALSLNFSSLCGGAIISSSWILTAAHCTFRYRAREIIVSAGSNELYIGTQWRRASRIINHPSFNGQEAVNDIALIQVSVPFDMTDPRIAQLCLPSQNSVDYPPIGSSVNPIDLNSFAIVSFESC